MSTPGTGPARRRAGAALLVTLWAAHLWVGLASAAAGGAVKPGAYCPFPKKGEKPACFTEVEQEYKDFFDAVDSGADIDDHEARLERELQEGGVDASLAVSSLAYGYFRLAQKAAAEAQPDPDLVARLQRWNQLLASVYQDAEAGSQFRDTVRDAAEDLVENAPAVSSECVDGLDANGAECNTAGTLLSALTALDDPANDTGVRGALSRMLGRFTSDDEEEPAE